MSNAFLHGILEEEVFMRQPSGFKDDTHHDYVCKLQRSIYGLKRSPRAWFLCLRDFLISLKFVESITDHFLFIFTDKEVTAYFLIYVDDMILTASSDSFITKVIGKLVSEFSLKDCGPLSFFLGIQLSTLQNGDVMVTQHQYLASLIQSLGLKNLKLASTPMEARIKFPKSAPLDDDG